MTLDTERLFKEAVKEWLNEVRRGGVTCGVIQLPGEMPKFWDAPKVPKVKSKPKRKR